MNASAVSATIVFSQPADSGRYEAHRYQLTDGGLHENALAQSLTLLKKLSSSD
ncbi:hypothetical protein [Streptomyces zaomyceticus]|uniref:hypothetical protein n=1 Tax=Streptomyces zaomyceticus TaxID=68286 RepID=UPI00341B1C1C